MEIRGYLNLDNQNEEEAAGDESGVEGSTLEESAAEDMDEEKSEDDNVAKEINSDMLLCTYIKKKNKKRIWNQLVVSVLSLMLCLLHFGLFCFVMIGIICHCLLSI